MKYLQMAWRLWAKSIGEKAHKKDQIADQVAVIRTIIFATYLITNMFIVAGVIRHWNNEPIKIYFYSTPSLRSNNSMV
jgi:hypothetical protein